MKSYGKQSISKDDIDAVTQALQDDFLTTGPRVEEFEHGFCEFVNAPHGVACNSGTAALHLASIAMNIQKGDQVIVPSLTFLASANAPHFEGAEIIFADVDPHTGLLTPQSFDEAVARSDKSRLKAVFPVHIGGQTIDMPALRALADALGIKIIADSCHALGSFYNGSDGEWHAVGSCFDEDMASFSFHPVKTLTTGEGGMLTTREESIANNARIMRCHGMEKDPDAGPWAYKMERPGYNYRLTDFQCALGLSQLKRLDHFITRRQHLADLYDRALAPLAPLILPPKRVEGCKPAWHLYAARIDFEAVGIARADFMKALSEKGVGTQVHYIPVHTQPYYKRLNPDLQLPHAEAYYERTLSLPLYPDLNDEDIDVIVDALKKISGIA